MPCLDISTNVNLDGVDVDSFFKEATTAVANIIGKPEKYVMVVLKGSANIHFGGNKEPAAFAEVVSMGGINSEVKKQLISSIGSMMEANFSIPRTRFFLKVFDTTMAKKLSKI
nr:macrophage migration inhibitory factor homolog [Ipomoea batatas]GME08820.1 macrophage migration inhibitory factor homolog [Ipomoea batatas]GME16104.1 macrophage migration inhibitory factor homolog [Ipomoea batatas]